jgi:ABC-type uncharacterized transport system auxiliary subunit
MNISRIPIMFYFSTVMLFTGAACTGLTQSDKPAISKWWLEPYTTISEPVPAEPPVSIALSVTVVPGLDTDRILTLSDDAELGQFASARWVDHLPELLASLVERSLQGTQRFVIVPESVASRAGDCLLELEFREFFADIGPGGRATGVRISTHGNLKCGSAGPLVFQSGVTTPVADERMNIIVAAFQQAMDQVTQDAINVLNKNI